MFPPVLPLREGQRLRHRDDIGLYRLCQGHAGKLARHLQAHGYSRGWADSGASARSPTSQECRPCDVRQATGTEPANSPRSRAAGGTATGNGRLSQSSPQLWKQVTRTCTQQSRALFSPGFQKSVESPSALLHRVRAHRVPTTRLTLRTTVHNAHTSAKINMNIELKLRVDLP